MDEKGIVLLLEDNMELLEINRRMLEKDGLIALTARNLAEARERIKIAVPDIAVLDIMLPDGSGLDFLVELRQVTDAPVLFLTAKTKHSDILAGFTAGGNDYITKPYNIDEFRMRVTSFLRLAKQRKNPLPPDSALNEKELIVAMLAARGMINKEIAYEVNLSESRVKACLSEIYRKLDIADKENKREMLGQIIGNIG